MKLRDLLLEREALVSVRDQAVKEASMALPGSAAWNQKVAARQALQDFDAAHPECVCAVRGCGDTRWADPNQLGKVPSTYCPWHESSRLLGDLPTIQPTHVRADYSYLPIDVGFDLRRHPHLLIELPADARTVAYDLLGKTTLVTGTREEIVTAMEKAGYRIAPKEGAHE